MRHWSQPHVFDIVDSKRASPSGDERRQEGCSPHEEVRAIQRKIQPMAKEFGRGLNRSDPDARGAIEKALLAETDPIALLVGLRAARGPIEANPSRPPTLDKPVASKNEDVAETARASLEKAAR